MNHQTKTHNLNNHFRSRVIFLDNLRYLLVFGVVLQHASNSYIGLDWWPVMDATNIIAEWLNAFFDSFLMPSRFFF